MKKLWLLSIIIVLFSCFPKLLSAQDIVKSEIVERISGKEYYIHTVKQGQTLYSISKVYDVPVDELIFVNPDSQSGLSIGQTLKIPLVSREKEISDDLRKGEFRYIFHIVKKGQTLYGIARIYDISVDDLKNANPEWIDGLGIGQYLKIPMKEAIVQDHQDETIFSGDPSPEKEKPDYFEHVVTSKETLYGIARKYRISIDSLKAFNPGLTVNIFPGEVIRIPAEINPDEYITHEVREKTKLKKLASKYALSVNSLQDANPDIGSRVYPGDLVMIPVGPPLVSESESRFVIRTPDDIPPKIVKNDSIRCYENIFQESKELRVALMIPLYTEETRDIKVPRDGSALDPSEFKPFNFIHFYEGFLMAIEDLEREGLKVKLYVYDVDEKVSKTIQVLQAPELSSMDLIVGPFFSRNFKLVSNFAEMFDIKIVNPLTRRDEVLSNANVFKVKPSRDAQPAMLSKFVKRYYQNSNIILVRNNKYQNSDDIVDIKSKLEKVVPYGVNISNRKIYKLIEEYSEADTNLAHGTLYSGIKIENRQIATQEVGDAHDDSTFFSNGIAEVIYANDSVYGIIRNASIARNNLVVVLSNNEIFTPEVLTRLNDLKDTFNITVVGMPEWEQFANLETDYLLDLKVYFFTDSYYDHDKSEVQAFIRGFRSRYKTHPESYAFEGYDLATFFLGAMMRFGSDCETCLPYYEKKLLKTSMKFAPAKPAGYENLYWNLCRYRNYKVEKVTIQ